MSGLDMLYQQVILDHSRQRSGEGDISGCEHTSHQVNPTCGDQVTLGATVDGDGLVTKITWAGDGCSISMASLSMMVDALTGQPVETAKEKFSAMEEMMHSRGKGVSEGVLDTLEDAAALEGTSKFANRIKCSLLGWYALRDVLAAQGIDLAGNQQEGENNVKND